MSKACFCVGDKLALPPLPLLPGEALSPPIIVPNAPAATPTPAAARAPPPRPPPPPAAPPPGGFLIAA